MEETKESIQPTPPRRRRKRSRLQIFKESYLPILIAVAAVILIITFIAGSVSRSTSDDEPLDVPEESTVDSAAAQQSALDAERKTLLAQAEALAAQYDYENAMKILSCYSGGMENSQELQSRYNEYNAALNALVPYEDMEHIVNLSFNLLIEDLDRALNDSSYGSAGSNAYRNNYITTNEFRAILEQLYANNYILVSVYDVAIISTDADGNSSMTWNTLNLPEGKTPVMLTQLAANYFTYMVDGDGDGIADANGDGFASKLILDENGALVNEMVKSDGSTVTGAFDLIPILEEFIAQHPDFSYKGARATIALTGYDGLFGYRTDAETATKISQSYYDSEVAAVGSVIQAVKAAGYDLACYTYDLANYYGLTSQQVQADIDLWNQEVTPLLGEVDILVYPNSYDIGTAAEYSGAKYDILNASGFRYYIRLDSSTSSWSQLTDAYYRMSRVWVTGSTLKNNGDLFSGLFDPASVLDGEA